MPSLLENQTVSAASLDVKDKELQKVIEKLTNASVIVLADLDLTTIAADYKPSNLQGLQNAVAELQAKGALIGLHSDSPKETNIQFANQFGMNGPQAFEMAAIHVPWAGIDIALDPTAYEFFATWKKNLLEAALSQLGKKVPKVHISNLEDRNKDKREGKKYPGFDYAVWINPFRRYSLGLWAEKISAEGTPSPDAPFLEEVNQIVLNALSQTPGVPTLEEIGQEFDWDKNPDYGVIIVKKKSLSSKTPLFSLLADHCGSAAKPLFMIGDGPADFIRDPRITTLAVANAKPELKRLISETSGPDGLNRISQGNMTEGVIEHLSAIEKLL